MIELDYRVQRWPMREAFVIANERYDYIDTVQLSLTDEHGNRGMAETCGVDYHGETAEGLCAELESLRGELRSGLDRARLQSLLPAGGTRNGIDCALWDLECRATGRSIWELTGVEPAASVDTLYTIGIVEPVHAAELATRFGEYTTLKLKADESGSLENIAAVREARPDATLIIDANQSWSEALFFALEPELLQLDVTVLEQPFPVGEDVCLDHYRGTLKLAADESLQVTTDLVTLAGRYDVVNIKLDKSGGLTEALAVASMAQQLDLGLMVGNMCGSSLGMAPAYVVARLCDHVDLDGPLLQTDDVSSPLVYRNGAIYPSQTGALWGGL